VAWAVAKGRDAPLEVLLESGADVTAMDNAGDSALHLAAKYGHASCAKALLQVGCDPGIRNSLGHDVYATAVLEGHGSVGVVLQEWTLRPEPPLGVSCGFPRRTQSSSPGNSPSPLASPQRRPLMRRPVRPKSAAPCRTSGWSLDGDLSNPEVQAAKRQEDIELLALEMADAMLSEKEEAIREEVHIEMRRERDAAVQSEKLSSVKVVKEYREREESYTAELDKLRRELQFSSQALEESSEVQRNLVQYRKEIRQLEDTKKVMERERLIEREEQSKQLQILQTKNAQLEAEVRVERERGRRLRGEFRESTTTAELDAVVAELELSLQNVKEFRWQRQQEEQQFLFGEQQQQMCVVCLTEPKSTLLAPCRHLCVCEKCGHELDCCPVCRSTITERTTVFL